MQIPAKIIQGDTIVWRDIPAKDSLGNQIAAPDWTLTYYFNGPTQFSAVAIANNDGWQVTLTSAQTTAMTPIVSKGDPENYFWQATASKGSEKVTLGTGTLKVLQNLATAPAGYDGRTEAEKNLAAVQATIKARISGGVVHEYMIGTRRLKNEPMSELLVLESRLKLMVSKEHQEEAIANGLGDPRNTFVRFT